MAATLDQLSGGRVVLGIGAGWQPNEHAAYGLALPAVRERLDALDEACGVITSLLSQRRSTVVGRSYRVVDAPCEPHPVQRRLPLLVGGGGERRTLRVAARYADVWHTWAGPETFSSKSAVLDGHCEEVGRDPDEVDRATGGTVDVGSRPRRGSGAGRADVQGTADEVVAQLLELRGRGVDEFIVRDHAANVRLDDMLRQIDVLSDAVVPMLDP
jgi:alkanesulfonate monooxygenase SsuD/methylene tetrahydromethanopterin reductase-like flavin-dependent oxidoreductase (luciferase family)